MSEEAIDRALHHVLLAGGLVVAVAFVAWALTLVP